MANLDIFQQILFRTSTVSDVINSAGILSVPGLQPVNKKRLNSITQVKYRAEVAQVKTIGNNSYTPTGATLYQVAVFDQNRRVSGGQEALKTYSYTTPDDVTTIGASVALQREAIHAAIITKINADTSANHATAASLGSGTGFTITDAGGYYPVHSQSQTNILGVNTVLKLSGFTAAPTSTTAGVYSVGVGANLLADAPVTDWMNGGNLVSGSPTAPKTIAGLSAQSGQNYDAFVINSLHIANNETASGAQLALINRIQTLWCDNGTGSSTANLTNYTAFEKVMLRLIVQTFAGDINGFGEFFDNRPVFSGIGTAGIPTGTDADINQIITRDWSWPYYLKGTSTQIFPLWDATNGSGLILDLDNAAEGLEIATQPLGAASQEFVVGKQPFSLYYKGKITDASQANPFYVGFRKKQAFNTAISGYTDYAALGFNASAATQIIKVMTVVGSAAEVSTSSAKTWADGESHVFEIRVDINGLCTFLVDSVDVTSVQTTAYSFTAGLTIIPFVRAIGTGGGAPTNTANAWIVLGNDQWRQ